MMKRLNFGHAAPSTRELRLVHELRHAQRCEAPFGTPRGSNPAARIGLRYERAVYKSLLRLPFRRIEHNPWFAYTDAVGSALASPDFLLWTRDFVIIGECKLTYTADALAKINGLYTHVVSAALNVAVVPLVICKTLVPSAPPARFSIGEALEMPEPLLHWLGNGGILYDSGKNSVLDDD